MWFLIELFSYFDCLNIAKVILSSGIVFVNVSEE